MRKINKGVCLLEEPLFKFDDFWGQMTHLDILCLLLCNTKNTKYYNSKKQGKR